MNHNVATLVGRLAADPMVKNYTRADGTAGIRCFLRLAITRKMDRSKKIGDASRRTNFVPIVAWGKRGELCAQYLQLCGRRMDQHWLTMRLPRDAGRHTSFAQMHFLLLILGDRQRRLSRNGHRRPIAER